MESVSVSQSGFFKEVFRMVPEQISPYGTSLSDSVDVQSPTVNNNSKALVQGSRSEYYITKREKLIPTSTSKTNLYIRGLTESTTDQDLHDLCQKYGEIKSTKAIVDKQTLKCKGYGFVDFKSIEDAKKALAELKKEQKDVQFAKQREQDPTNLYFANLPGDIDEQCLANMLRTKFSANVSSTRIMRERSGSSKGVGFARIDDNKLCDDIISELNNKPFPENNNKSRLISVKLADSSGILKPFKKQNSENNLENKDSLNNTIENSSSTSSLALSSNENNANHASQANNQTPQLIHPSFAQYTNHPYQQSPYMDTNNYSSLPVMMDNYHHHHPHPHPSSPAYLPQTPTVMAPHHHVPMPPTPPHHHYPLPHHNAMHRPGHYMHHPSTMIPQSMSPYHTVQQAPYYPPQVGPGTPNTPNHFPMQTQMPYYYIQGQYQQQQQQQQINKQLNIENLNTSSSSSNLTGQQQQQHSSTSLVTQQFSSMSMASH